MNIWQEFSKEKTLGKVPAKVYRLNSVLKHGYSLIKWRKNT